MRWEFFRARFFVALLRATATRAGENDKRGVALGNGMTIR
jgi:hypothetical protein